MEVFLDVHPHRRQIAIFIATETKGRSSTYITGVEFKEETVEDGKYPPEAIRLDRQQFTEFVASCVRELRRLHLPISEVLGDDERAALLAHLGDLRKLLGLNNSETQRRIEVGATAHGS